MSEREAHVNKRIGETERRLEKAYRVDPLLYMQLLDVLQRVRDEAEIVDADAEMTRAHSRGREHIRA
jgi:hypothetical protein